MMHIAWASERKRRLMSRVAARAAIDIEAYYPYQRRPQLK